MGAQPSVLFVCVKNAGKSQIAAALMRQLGGVEVFSAGTTPGSAVNAEGAEAVREIGASMAGQSPQPIDPLLLARVDRVVVLGAEAKVDPVEGMRGEIVTWVTDEPSLRGVVGMERMRLVRDDIAGRVAALHGELLSAGPTIRVFEPALCCNTGVCGPELDDALVGFTADLAHLRGMGVDLQRHNLANEPLAFSSNPMVASFLRVVGSSGLPLVLVNDVTVMTGRYPDRDELLRLAGLAGHGSPDLGLTATGCCTSGAKTESGCC